MHVLAGCSKQAIARFSNCTVRSSFPFLFWSLPYMRARHHCRGSTPPDLPTQIFAINPGRRNLRLPSLHNPARIAEIKLRSLFSKNPSSHPPAMAAARLSLMALLLVLAVAGRAAAQDYDFFYLVLQWPGSYCDTKQSCCYPRSGKPAADFGIHGLWPNRDDGSYPQNCNPDNAFNPSKVSDLLSSLRAKWPTLACPTSDGLRFWGHEWDKHGTCAADVFDEHSYFKTALGLRDQLGVLAALTSAGVNPDGGYYSLDQIKSAIQQGTGFEPYVECNRDESGNSQLYQLYFCVNKAGDSFVDCPVLPTGRPCGNRIEFPAF